MSYELADTQILNRHTQQNTLQLLTKPWVWSEDLPHELETTMLGEAHALKRMMADMTCMREKQTR